MLKFNKKTRILCLFKQILIYFSIKNTLICILERLVGFIYNGVRYFYQRNIQGDITAIYNEDSNLVNILTDPGICLSGYLQH